MALLTLVISSCGGANGSASESPPVSTGSAGNDLSEMSLNNIETLDFADSSTSLNFDGKGDALVVVNSTGEIGSDISVQLNRGGLSALVADDRHEPIYEDPESAESQFHQYLREMETVLRESGDYDPPEAASLTLGSAGGGRAALAVSPKVGDLQSFRVISTMSSITNYAEVAAELRLATDNLYVYVDESVRGNISDEDLESLASDFEDIALSRERAIMGPESDINFDEHISILMTCVVNRMAGTGGLVTGFFFPGDLYQRSAVNPASNAQEIFYVLAPDPKGNCGTPITADFAVHNILPGVLAHEYQHMNSFNQHVFKNGGTTEEPWLNECLSHLSEDLTGFGRENASRVRLFFAQPSKTPLVPPTSPTLAERGACYTFLRYLYEQSPDRDAFLSRLYGSKRTGIANLEAAFQGSPDFDEFPEFVNRWSIALSLSGTGLSSDPHYNFRERSTDTQTGQRTGLCIRCDAQDGRGTVLAGPVMTTVAGFPTTTTMKGTATQFYRVNNPSGTVTVNGSSGTSLKGAVITLVK